MFSRPTATLIMVLVIPLAFFSDSGISACVTVLGCVTSVSAPPRLGARVTSFRLSKNDFPVLTQMRILPLYLKLDFCVFLLPCYYFQ